MQLPEYGRYVVEMIKHLRTLPSKTERQRCAEAIVTVMTNIHPELREQPDYMQCVWDHLAYIGEYSLDIDYPYPINRMGNAATLPDRLQYPKRRINRMQYGLLIESFLARLATMEEGEAREEMLSQMANQMKQTLFNWNRDAMDHEKIASDIDFYTGGKVHLDLSKFRFGAVHTLPRQDTANRKPNKLKKK